MAELHAVEIPKNEKELTYYELNNKINIPVNGQIQLQYDKEAVKAYFRQHINQSSLFSYTLEEKIDTLILGNYISKEMIEKYDMKFIKKLFKSIYAKKFRFDSFMGAYKFYRQYAMKNDTGDRYLERFEDRVAFNALYLADGDEELAMRIGEEMISRRYQPATPTYLNAGKVRAGEAVSCFTGDTLVTVKNNGRKRIDSITEDDYVLTHEGTYEKVIGTNVRKYKGKMIELKAWGIPESVKSTPEHPFLVYREKGNFSKEEIALSGDGDTDNLKWIKAEYIRNGDFIVESHSKKKFSGQPKKLKVLDFVREFEWKEPLNESYIEIDGKTYKKLIDRRTIRENNTVINKNVSPFNSHVFTDYKLGYLLGAFIAEGHLQKYPFEMRDKYNEQNLFKSVNFTVNSEDEEYRDKIHSYIEDVFGITPVIKVNKDNSTVVILGSYLIADFFYALVGSGYNRKIFSEEIMSSNNKGFIEGILSGMFRGDGYVTSGVLKIMLANRHIILQVGDLLNKINVTFNTRFTMSSWKNNPSEMGEITIPNNRKENFDFTVSVGKNIDRLKEFSPENKYNKYYHRIMDGYKLHRVKNIHIYDSEDINVYNLEVENNHNYTANGMLVHNCFLIGDVTDSMDSITRSWVSSAHLSKLGGGVGIDLSNVREEGAPIKGIHGAASGVVPIMKIYEDIFSYANQLGQRQGAGAVYLNIFHMDVIQFLATRKENADEKVRVKTLSLGLTVPDKYYELIKKDEWMYLFSPYDAERVYGKPFSFIDITKEYDNMVNNPEIRKSKVKARELETEISKLQQESGYPYILNIDTVNKANPVHGKVVMSNLCTEIMQVHKTSEMNKDQTYKTIGNDVSCNLGSINIPNMMKSKDFGRSIDTMIRALTTVSDKTDIQEVPTIRKANTSYHSVGLGAMGLATYFAINKMEYGSPESIEFVDVFFRMVNYYSLVASNNIAKERKSVFHEFEKSKYYTGEYFDRYINEGNVAFKNPKIERMFKGFHIPTVEDWKELARKVKTHGLYHSYRLAVAPNGSISYVNETSASLHPIINLIEERQEKKIGKVYYPVPHLNNNTIKYYKSAYDTDMRKVIDVYAAAQKHIDQGMSLTLFMRSDIPEGLYEWKDGRTTKMTTRDLNILRNYAWKKGIKSLYYVRTFTDDAEEIGASQCESCSI